MGLPLKTKAYYDNSGGLDTRSSPTKTAEDAATLSLNIDYSTDGAFFTRNGSKIQNMTAGVPAQISGAPQMLAIYDYHKSDGTEVIVSVGNDGKIYEGLVTPTASVTGLTTTGMEPDFEFVVTGDDEYLVYCDGINANLKFNGTDWTNLSLPRAAAPTLTDLGAGSLDAGDYYYYVSFAVTSGGVIVQEGELSPVSSVLTIAANREIRVTIPTCSETLATGVTAQCNARVIYRISPNSSGVAYRIATVADNVTTTYDDDDPEDGTIEADFDNQAAPISRIVELDDYGQAWFNPASQKTDAMISKAYKPWNVPTENNAIYDGKINCIKRCFGTLVIGTDKSIWVQNGPFATTDSRKFNSTFGILNNRCADGSSRLYIIGTNRKLYSIDPTDFSQNEMRVSAPLSDEIPTLFSTIGASASDKVALCYYTKANVAKVTIAAPLNASTNNYILVYNEEQSLVKKKPVWQPWDNLKASCLKQMTVSGESDLYSGDYNGFIWKLDDDSINGDGTEDNGTATGGSTTTIVDTTKTWTVNAYKGMVVRGIDGTGEDQSAVISSNTSDTLTFPAVSTAFASGSEYTIGGYDNYHFGNWKYVLSSYDFLKQLWYILANANADGDYPISLILQFDFDESISNQTVINFTLSAGNTIWGAFLWLGAAWGAMSVFQSRYRYNRRFRAVRLGFMSRKAGQPFQINGYSISCQDKGLFYGSAP